MTKPTRLEAGSTLERPQRGCPCPPPVLGGAGIRQCGTRHTTMSEKAVPRSDCMEGTRSLGRGGDVGCLGDVLFPPREVTYSVSPPSADRPPRPSCVAPGLFLLQVSLPGAADLFLLLKAELQGPPLPGRLPGSVLHSPPLPGARTLPSSRTVPSFASSLIAIWGFGGGRLVPPSPRSQGGDGSVTC